MRLLLDTHIVLWAADERGLLPRRARALIVDGQNQLYFSAVSIWEIAIKHALNRPDFYAEPRTLRRQLLLAGYAEVALTGDQAAGVGDLPMLHKDLFDRLLLAQAIAERMTLVTADAALRKYAGPVLMV